MEAKHKCPESVEEAEKTQENGPDLQAEAAEAGKYQPIEPVVAEIGRDGPVGSVVADAGTGERLEPLDADAGNQKHSVETVAAEPEKTAERKDDPQASYAATGASPRERPDVSRVVARGLLTKHPLQHRWSLWYYRYLPLRSWKETLMEMTSFETLEDFWALYNDIELASNLPRGCDYALFRYGIEPSQEDVRNKDGGFWFFAVDRYRRKVDNDWFEVLMCLVAEQFGEHSGDVCGAVLQVRTAEDYITVWTTDSSREVANIVIGRTLKEKLRLHPRNLIPYHSHADTMQTKCGAEVKTKYKV